jgi:hypothetical protein
MNSLSLGLKETDMADDRAAYRFLALFASREEKYGRESLNLQNGHNPKSYIFRADQLRETRKP